MKKQNKSRLIVLLSLLAITTAVYAAGVVGTFKATTIITDNLTVTGTATLSGDLVSGGAISGTTGTFSDLIRTDDGAAGTNGTATGAGDIYAEDALEVDGSSVLQSVTATTISASGLVRTDDGAQGTPAVATGAGDIYAEDSIEAGLLMAAPALIAGTSVSSPLLTHADLVINSTNAATLQINEVGVLQYDDSAISGFAAGSDTAGAAVFIEMQSGGTASGDTDGANASDLTITGGAGSDGGAHTSNDPNGGDSSTIRLATLAGGAAGAGGSGVAGKQGMVVIAGANNFARTQGAVHAETTAATLELTELLAGIITVTHSAGANQNYVLPTGTLMSAGVNLATGEGFEWTLINLSGTGDTNTATVTAGTDHTVVGNMVVDADPGTANFLSVKTGATTWVTYRK